MINHNFLPYEVCSMLPKINPYPISHQWVVWSKSLTRECLPIGLVNNAVQHNITDCWTILDALQYIQDTKRYVVESLIEIGGQFYFTIVSLDTPLTVIRESQELYNTKTEAYIAGIKYTLKEL